MSKKVDKLAGKIATNMLRSGGIAKSADSTAVVMPAAVAIAELIVAIQKRLKVNGRLIEQNGRKIQALAERSAAMGHPLVPGAPAVEARFRDLNEQEFGLQLVRTRAAKQANGHSRVDGPESSPAPSWHPENDNQ